MKFKTRLFIPIINNLNFDIHILNIINFSTSIFILFFINELLTLFAFVYQGPIFNEYLDMFLGGKHNVHIIHY